MSTLISCATGLFSAAGTWALVDPTSLLDSEAGYTEFAVTPAWTSGVAFVPGAITIDGIAIKLAIKPAAPTGTLTIRLYDVTAGAAVAGTTVIIDAADLPLCGNTTSNGG